MRSNILFSALPSGWILVTELQNIMMYKDGSDLRLSNHDLDSSYNRSAYLILAHDI